MQSERTTTNERNDTPMSLTRKERLARTGIALIGTTAVLTALAFEASDNHPEAAAQATSSASIESCAIVTAEAGQGATSLVKEAVRKAELTGARSITVSSKDSESGLRKVHVTDEMVKDLETLEYAESIGEEITDSRLIQPNDVFKYCTVTTVSSDGSWNTGRDSATYTLESPNK